MKKLWRNNKILVILGAILAVCFIAILIVVLKYFVGSRNSVYGNRFDNMKTVIKEKEQNEYIKKVEESSTVEKVRLRVSHKTLYISITLKDDIKLEDAKKVADESLVLFSDGIKETYDINFTISGKTFGTLMGARNASGNGLLWSNNTPVDEAQ